MAIYGEVPIKNAIYHSRSLQIGHDWILDFLVKKLLIILLLSLFFGEPLRRAHADSVRDVDIA